MKKYLKVTIMERYGVCGNYKPCEYVVNKKFCDRYGIAFEGRDKNDIALDIINMCNHLGIQIVSIH